MLWGNYCHASSLQGLLGSCRRLLDECFLRFSLGFAFASVVYGPESGSGEPVSTALVSSCCYLASLPSSGRFPVQMELLMFIGYSNY